MENQLGSDSLGLECPNIVQEMTNSVGFTFSVGDTTWVVCN